jgi:hypothetical protein
MTTIEPLSTEEIAGLREYHVPVRVWRGSATWIVCDADVDAWPCELIRALATINALQAALAAERSMV